MSPEEERDLIRRAQQGCRDSMARLLAQHHQALYGMALHTIARGLEVEDLYQFACLHFIESVRKIDLSLNTRLTTYVYDRVRQRLWTEARTHGLIALPKQIAKQASKEVRTAVSTAVARAARIDRDTDNFHGYDDGQLLSLDDRDYREHVQAIINDGLRFLTERERDMILLRAQGQTLDEVGERYGLGKERVRQITESAYKRLRHYLHGKLDADVLTRYNAAP